MTKGLFQGTRLRVTGGLLPHKPHQPISVIDRQFQVFHGAEADLSGDLNAQSFAD
jgi:hypothetical protein